MTRIRAAVLAAFTAGAAAAAPAQAGGLAAVSYGYAAPYYPIGAPYYRAPVQAPGYYTPPPYYAPEPLNHGHTATLPPGCYRGQVYAAGAWRPVRICY